MKVKFLGQACTLIEIKEKIILCDPWIVGPCNTNSWYPLNRRIHTKKDIPTDVDYIYISHEHTDHFHSETLKEFDKTIPVFICKFPTDRFYNSVIKEGFKDVNVLNSWEKKILDKNLEITIIKNSELMLEDSAILIKSNEGTIFCQTDCGMSYESLQRVREAKPDLGFFKFGAANWFPVVYNYEKDKKTAICKKRKANKLTGFVAYVKAVKPKYAIPYAGPPFFLHKPLIDANDPNTGMFASPDEAKKAWDEDSESGTEIILMAPSDEISINGEHTKNGQPVFSHEKMEISHQLAEQVENDLNQRWNDEGTASKNLNYNIIDYFNKIISENPIARRRIDIKVQFIADGKNGGDFVLDFSKDRENGPHVKEGRINDWNYYMKLPAQLVQKAVNNELLWETIFLSCRWVADRKSDNWNEHLMNLFYDPDPKRIQNIYKIYDNMFT